MKFLEKLFQQDNLFRAVIPWNSARIPIITLSMLIIQVFGYNLHYFSIHFFPGRLYRFVRMNRANFEYKLNCNRNRHFYYINFHWLIDWSKSVSFQSSSWHLCAANHWNIKQISLGKMQNRPYTKFSKSSVFDACAWIWSFFFSLPFLSFTLF